MKINAAKGFSALELVVVLAIMAVMVSIAAPLISKYQHNTNLREAARDLAADIALMKQRAAAEGVRFRIIFDVNANNYKFQIEQPADSGTYVDLPTAPNTKSPAGIGANIVIVNPLFAGGVPFMTFQQRGTVSAGSVILRNRILSTATITTSMMGRVNVTFNML